MSIVIRPLEDTDHEAWATMGDNATARRLYDGSQP